MRLALFLLPLLGCPPSEEERVATWFATCGDPACRDSGWVDKGLEDCTDEVVGDACTDVGAACDPHDPCNSSVVCAETDPATECPISRKVHKRDIAYVSDADRAALAGAARDLRLATWRYRWEPAATPAHVGFLIDDAPESPAVAAGGERVDLYGYTSLVLALAQEQAARIEQQEARLAEQAARIEQQEARLVALEARLTGVGVR